MNEELAARIDLAHVADLTIGVLAVRPAVREVSRGDGDREVVEPRVMQVLVALARANGAVVSRDDLIQSCWEGRVIGEDAINRVISRLRRVGETIGQDSFRVETVTKVGYRLVERGGNAAVAGGGTAAPLSRAATGQRSRRTLIQTGAAICVAGIAGGVGWRLLVRPQTDTRAGVGPLLDQAWQSWTQGTGEGNSQAIGLYRRAVAIAPGYADAWGLLACAYGDRSHVWASAAERPSLRQRAREAGSRALQLDPRNAYGRAAIAYARPLVGNWLLMEREFRRALADQPGKWLITYSVALLLTRVGRLSEAADIFGQLTGNAPTATQYFFHTTALWGAGRLDEAERLLEEASAIYGTNPLIWSLRFDMLLSDDRPGAAIALASDAATRPTGFGEAELGRLVAVAKAHMSRRADDNDAAAAALTRSARDGAGQATRAIQDLAGLGRVDEAFAIALALFFSRGFVIPDDGAGGAATLDERPTGFLFLPPLASMRADRRFAALTAELGLERYWRESGTRPDYRR